MLDSNALLKSRLLSLAVACVTAFQPIMVWLSLSGLADGMGIFAALVGVFGWVRYRSTGSVWLAILSAAGFLCATAVKTEYAAFAAGFALLAGFEAWRLRGSVKSRILIACIPLAGLFMIIYMIWWKMLSGSFMGFSIAFRANYENTWIAALTPTPLSRLVSENAVAELADMDFLGLHRSSEHGVATRDAPLIGRSDYIFGFAPRRLVSYLDVHWSS